MPGSGAVLGFLTMSPTEAILRSWSFPAWVTALNLLAALLYLRGWLSLRALLPVRLSGRRLASFLGGLAVLQAALASPIDAFDAFSLADHMAQHLLMMFVIPPLILLGNPGIPLMRGLPCWARRRLGTLLRWQPFVWLVRTLTRPSMCLLLFTLAMIAWHLPGPYDLALRSPAWHEGEHFCFLLTSLLFWWPVVQPWPSIPRCQRWSLIPYLLLTDFVNSGLCAFLVFSGRVLYPFYSQFPRLNQFSVQDDQAFAGALMWIVSSVALLIPAVVIALKLLSPSPAEVIRVRGHRSSETRMVRYVLPALACALPIAALVYGLCTADAIDIDGDIVQQHAASGRFVVTLFTSPQLSIGNNDLAVLVQDSASGEPVTNAAVEIFAESADGSTDVRAVREPAANKLLKAAAVQIPGKGVWKFRTVVRFGADQETLSRNITLGSRDVRSVSMKIDGH